MPLVERVRLWISYQRYALLLGLAPVCLVGATVLAAPGAWWAWGPLALISIGPLRFAVEVYGRLPRKLRATLLADRRHAAGRFRAEMVRPYCGDPCFRVVAHEMLRRAGLPPAERRTLIRKFRAEQAERGHQLVLVDRQGGVLYQVDGTSIRRHELRHEGGHDGG